MPLKYALCLAVSVSVCLPVSLHAEALKPAYTRIDQFFPFSVPGSKATYPLSINDAGTITGSYIDQSNVVHGFVRDGSGNISTFDPPGSILTEPSSINAEGDVTGHFEVANNLSDPLLSFITTLPQGFLRQADGTITTFGATGAQTSSGYPQWAEPVAINDAGEIIGNFPSIALGSNVFVHSPEGTLNEYTLSSGADYSTVVTGLNDGGAEVGYTTNGAIGQSQGFLWNGYSQTPGYPPTVSGVSMSGSVGTFPSGINAEGDIVGSYTTGTLAAPVSHDFFQAADGTVTALSTPAGTTPGCSIGITVSPIVYDAPPASISINDRGTIIGCFTGASGAVGSFVRYSNGTTIAVTRPGSQQTRATAINNYDILTGYYSVGNTVVGFIFEPSAQF
jgi:hypothetical protein